MFLIAAQLTTSDNLDINTSTNASQVNFTCEMSAYIPPDEDLQWISNEGTILESSEKYTITYRNGRQSAAQKGGRRRSPSRISTLVLHTPTAHDSGEYECVLSGTPQSITFALNVEVVHTTSDNTTTNPNPTGIHRGRETTGKYTSQQIFDCRIHTIPTCRYHHHLSTI